MLSKAQERILRELQLKKGRRERGMFIIEGEKFVREAKNLVEFTFTPKDTNQFREYVSTENPQTTAAVAKIPHFTLDQVLAFDVVVVLDGVQDPGNVGTVLRACLGFRAAVVLVECADVTNPKAVRASTSALLYVPWVEMKREEATEALRSLGRKVYRLENRPHSVTLDHIGQGKILLIAGNEGSGISLALTGTSVKISHERALESLNVAVATSLVLHEVYQKNLAK